MDKQNIIVAFLRVKKYFHEGSRLYQIILNMLNNRRSLKKTIFDCSVEADNIMEILQDAIDVFIDESDSDEESSESDNEESSEYSDSDNEDYSKKFTYQITEDDLERLEQSGLFDMFQQYSRIGYGQQFLDRLRETYEKEFVTSIEKDSSFGEHKINMIRTIVGEDLKSIIENDIKKSEEDYKILKHDIDAITAIIESCKNKQL